MLMCRIMCLMYADDYDEAVTLSKLAEETSDVERGKQNDENCRPPRKRRAPVQLIDANDGDGMQKH